MEAKTPEAKSRESPGTMGSTTTPVSKNMAIKSSRYVVSRPMALTHWWSREAGWANREIRCMTLEY